MEPESSFHITYRLFVSNRRPSSHALTNLDDERERTRGLTMLLFNPFFPLYFLVVSFQNISDLFFSFFFFFFFIFYYALLYGSVYSLSSSLPA